MINTSDFSYQICDVTNPATVSGSGAVKKPFSLDETPAGNQTKESVSYKQYNSNFLLKIQSMCKSNFPSDINTTAFNILKKLNLIKSFSKNTVFEKYRPHSSFVTTTKANFFNEPVCKRNKSCISPQNVSSTSPKCPVARPLSQKFQAGENVLQTCFFF